MLIFNQSRSYQVSLDKENIFETLDQKVLTKLPLRIVNKSNDSLEYAFIPQLEERDYLSPRYKILFDTSGNGQTELQVRHGLSIVQKIIIYCLVLIPLLGWFFAFFNPAIEAPDWWFVVICLSMMLGISAHFYYRKVDSFNECFLLAFHGKIKRI